MNRDDEMTPGEYGAGRGLELEEEQVAALLRLARRMEPPVAIDPARRDRVRSAVEEEWRSAIRSRRRRRWLSAALPVAACLGGLMVGPWLKFTPKIGIAPAVPPPTVAVLERSIGQVDLWSVSDGQETIRELSAGEDLPGGAKVETTAGARALLRLASGVRLRLDHASAVRLRPSPSDLACELLAGAVYVEAEVPTDETGRRRLPAFTVDTPMGPVHDLGTRFEVRLEGKGLVVRVRSGAVEVRRERLVAGQELRIAPDAPLQRATLAPWDDEWLWTRTVAPAFDPEGRPLVELLDWVAAEEGLEVRFRPSSLSRQAAETVHGSLAGLTPRETLATALPTAGLSWSVRDGELIVERDRSP